MRTPLSMLLLAVSVVGCECRPPNLVGTLPPDVRVDTYTQQAASKIDVLWVVDNSGSMAPRQENIARNFSSFITEFTRNSIDYRIAVTTTDIFKEAGRFVGTPKILSPTTPNVATAFANNVKVGINGSPFEVGLEAARMSLDLQAQANAASVMQCQAACPTTGQATCRANCETNTVFQFLRRDAYLYLIFVTDEEDRSSQDVRYFYRYFETVKGVGNDGTVTTAAIMGDTPSNTCGATPGTRYKALSDLTGGEVGSICDTNFSTTLGKLARNAVGLKRKFALQAKPNIQTIQVRLRYPCNVPADQTAACASIDRTKCEGNPADSMNVVCTPRQGAPDGWEYEEGGNLVYFAGESVPGLSGQIELQYYEEGKGP
ncbi:MAG: vWA domain-containing protein [Archangium sp.]|nr:vWA domain-containing protein [Archangium sp.]